MPNELKIQIGLYVRAQTACNKDCGCRGFFLLRGLNGFYFLHGLDISKDVWVGHLLDLSPGGNPALIVHVPVSLAALLMCLFCSVFPAVCSGLKFVLSCVG